MSPRHFDAPSVLSASPRKDTQNPRISLILSAKIMKKDARTHFQRSVELDSDNTSAHINYGIALVTLSRWQDAITQLAPIARAEPKRFIARTNLVIALAGRGGIDQGTHELKEALQIARDYSPAREALEQIQNRRI